MYACINPILSFPLMVEYRHYTWGKKLKTKKESAKKNRKDKLHYPNIVIFGDVYIKMWLMIARTTPSTLVPINFQVIVEIHLFLYLK